MSPCRRHIWWAALFFCPLIRKRVLKPETLERRWTSSVVRWFDSYAVQPSAKQDIETAAKKVDWVRVIPFIALHVACLRVFWVG